MNGIATLYGGYAPTIQAEADVLARRYNPFAYLATGAPMPVEAYPTEVPNGYADGGTVNPMPATTALVSLLQQVARRRQDDVLGAALPRSVEGGAGIAAGTAASGNTPASMSGANWGPTAFGGDGLSPGRSTGLSLGLAGLAQGIPGAGVVGMLGQGFNAGARSGQLADAIGQMAGQDPGLNFGQALGQLGLGAIGRGTSMADFNEAATAHGMSPDEAQAALTNFSATGNINLPASAVPGFGIAGLAGAAASGVSPDVALNPGSLAAFGANMTDPVGSVGNDGVTSYAGGFGPGFGGMASGDQATAASNSEGSQGNGGANGAGGNSGGGSGGGGGSNGGGGDNGGGWARGGRVGLSRRFARGSGLVPGMTGGRSDQLSITAPQGSYVIPADVVSGMGEGNTDAGAARLAQLMPQPGKVQFASGGIVGSVPEIPIQISPGEFVVHPAHVDALGGSNALDRLVQQQRAMNMAVAQGMPGPR